MTSSVFFKSLSILLLVCSYLSVSFSLASLYPDKIRFQHLLANHDLVLGEVRAILQSSDGFMWFGCEKGFIRYDGYQFVAMDIESIVNGEASYKPATLIRSLIEDNQQTIWVAPAAGLAWLDKDKEKLTLLDNDPEQAVNINEAEIYRMVSLPNGKLLASSSRGLFVVDVQEKRYQIVLEQGFKLSEEDSYQDHIIVGMSHKENSELVWLGGKYVIMSYDWQRDVFTSFKLPKELGQPKSPEVMDFVELDNGSLWLATRSQGIFHFNPKTKQYKQFKHDPNNTHSLGANDVWDLHLDSKGRLWAATDKGGLNLFIEEKAEFIRYKHKSGTASSIASDVVRTIIEDDNHDLWLGLYPEGIEYFDQTSAAISSFKNDANDSNSLSHTAVSSVNLDENENLWLGTDGGGLNFFNRETGKFKHYKHNNSDPQSISSNSIISSWQDSEGYLWLGTWAGGFNRFDPKTEMFTRIPFDKNAEKKKHTKVLATHSVWSIFEDSRHNLWLGTLNSGLVKYDRETKGFTNYLPIEGDSSSLPHLWVWKVYEDSQNNLWVGTYLGMALMDRDKGTFINYLSAPNDPKGLSNPVLTFYEDSKGRFWIGSTGGLNLFDRKEKTFSRVTIDDGLFNDNIRSILEDDNGVLWLATGGGVSSYDPETKKIKNYYRDSGKLVGSFFYNARAKTKSGDLIFGGTNGLRIYKPKELLDNLKTPPIVFNSLSVFSEQIRPKGKDGILKQHINKTNEITLDYFQSMFVLEYAALNFRQSEKNRYSYKLEGFDKQWNKESADRKAKYTNLDAGTYTFKVRGSNNDGIWNETPKTLKINILPPPWHTWWAYTLYVLILLTSSVWFLYLQREKRHLVEEQNRQLERKVKERTKEILQKNQDIQAMLSHIQQGLFTILDNYIIHPEYSIFLEDIFETTDIAGRNIMELLFDKANIGSNVRDEIKESMGVILGADEFNYELNHHLLISKINICFSNTEKYLELSWNPIVIDGVVEKLMVTVRDVTLLKQMEKDALVKQKELDIISQLLDVSSSKFIDFENTAFDFIKENKALIEESRQCTKDILAQLFRNIHTIKGNSRTFGFSFLSDLVHDAESVYSEMQKQENLEWNQKWSKKHLLDDLLNIDLALKEYAQIYHEVLGRGVEKTEATGDGYWLNQDKLKLLRNCADALVGGQMAPEIGKKANHVLDTMVSTPLPELLKPLTDSLAEMANFLEKESPTLDFACDGIRINNEAEQFVINVFSHLLRNSLDHGIELPEQRLAAGKPKQGAIVIKAEVATESINGYLRIIVSDDGKGLNIESLYNKGLELGLWQQGDKVDNNKVADLIFTSGLSTKEQVSDISGRGVGMDAVNQFLIDKGCQIELNLLSEQQDGCDYTPFETVLYLPPEFYIKVSNIGTD